MTLRNQQNIDDRLLLTVPEASFILNVNRSTMYKLMHARSVRYIKVRGCTRIPRVAIEEYISSGLREDIG